MGYYRIAIIILFLASCLEAQSFPPTSKTVKKRQNDITTVSWELPTPLPNFVLQWWKVKGSYDRINTFDVVIAAPTSTSAAFPAKFTPTFPKFAYFIVTGVYDGPQGRVESLNPKTSVGIERIGPPPQ